MLSWTSDFGVWHASDSFVGSSLSVYPREILETPAFVLIPVGSAPVIPVTAALPSVRYITVVARTSLVTPWLTKLGDEAVHGPQTGDGLIFYVGIASLSRS
jgi:hypothetical protein